MNLKEKVKSLPNTPGVYRMKDADGNILYVGKSKNLKNRVSQYFTPSYGPSNKIEIMIRLIDDVEVIHTDTEFDALLLECQLIKEIQPMYNTQMKKDKGYSYLQINLQEQFPTVEVVRQKKEDGQLYFGPYRSKGRLEQIKDVLVEQFKLRKCRGSNSLRKCLNYDLGICMGPCRNSNEEQYQQGVQQLIDTLKGRDHTIIQLLKEKMGQAIETLAFEQGAKYRDQLEMIKSILYQSASLEFIKENKELLVVMPVDGERIKLYLMRGKRVLDAWIAPQEALGKLELVQEILDKFGQHHIPSEQQEKLVCLEKKDVDLASIIYGYLQHNEQCWYRVMEHPISEEDLQQWLKGVKVA